MVDENRARIMDSKVGAAGLKAVFVRKAKGRSVATKEGYHWLLSVPGKHWNLSCWRGCGHSGSSIEVRQVLEWMRHS